MRANVVKLVAIYFMFVLIFVVQKPIFMLWYHDLYANVSLNDYLEVMYNGLPLDNSLAGYLTVIPTLLLIVGQWCHSGFLSRIWSGYYYIVAVLLSLVFCLDIFLYGYWGVKLDVTPFFYFVSSPASALASASIWYIMGGVLAIIIFALICIALMRLCRVLSLPLVRHHKSRFVSSLVLLALAAVLFIPIRGGFTVSTMNLSRVYYSQNQRLNHAAINPVFSLMYSATHQSRFNEQFRFHTPEIADVLFAQMEDRPVVDSIPRLLNCCRPDIYIVIFESFSSHLMSTLGGTHPVAANLDSIASNGILFTDFYANGYRTDRSLPAILSAYPSQPTTSIMKDVSKTDNLPSIPMALKNAGYNLTYYYGGDANFTNMYAYLVSAGFDTIISDKDFPLSDRLSKWGAHDHIVFNRCIDDVESYCDSMPALRVIQTSSSHEPFDVPYSNPCFQDKRANAFAYADSCLGDFVSQLKKIGKWDNSLIVITPDHYGAYPQGLDNPVDRHRIPLVLAGGAVNGAQRIEVTASQVDIAATLLFQLGIPHDQFVFSRNILNVSSPHFAFFVDPSQIGFVASGSEVVYNCDADKIVYERGEDADSLLVLGKAFLQKLYDDLDNR